MIYFRLQGRFPQSRRIEQFVCDVINFLHPTYPEKRHVITLSMKRSLHTYTKSGYVEQNAGETYYYSLQEIQINLARNYVSGNGTFTLYEMDSLAKTIAHELVHAKQIIKGKLLLHKEHSNVMLYGKPYDHWRDVDFYSLPWEKEALHLQEILVNKFWR